MILLLKRVATFFLLKISSFSLFFCAGKRSFLYSLRAQYYWEMLYDCNNGIKLYYTWIFLQSYSSLLPRCFFLWKNMCLRAWCRDCKKIFINGSFRDFISDQRNKLEFGWFIFKKCLKESQICIIERFES